MKILINIIRQSKKTVIIIRKVIQSMQIITQSMYKKIRITILS